MANRNSRPWHRKFRGGRRYYSGLTRRAAEFSLDLSADRWFDLHHTHFDRVGHGRRGAQHRRRHLVALFTAFRRITEQARASGRPLQVWVSVAADAEVEQDALYVHSPNPNGTPFPYPFPGIEWSVTGPRALHGLVSQQSDELGHIVHEGQPQYVVRERSRESR